MRDIIISLIVALLIISLGIFFVFEKREETNVSEDIHKMEVETSLIRSEKKSFQRELEELNKNYKAQTVGASRVILLFNDIDSDFVREICPLLQNRDIVGVMTLTKNNLPSNSSLLTKDAFNSLIDKGWETTLYYDGAVDVKLWYSEEKEAFDNGGIPLPTTVVVPNGVYTEELYNEFYTLGFEDIILKTYQPDISKTSDFGTLTVTDSVGWYTTNAAGIITLFSSRTGDIAFTVLGKTADEKYETEQFGKMIDTISHSVQKGLVFYSTPSRSREYKNKLLENEVLLSDSYEKKRAELQEKINELDKEIERIYDEYLEEK